jgi:hypothetical protein
MLGDKIGKPAFRLRHKLITHAKGRLIVVLYINISIVIAAIDLKYRSALVLNFGVGLYLESIALYRNS